MSPTYKGPMKSSQKPPSKGKNTKKDLSKTYEPDAFPLLMTGDGQYTREDLFNFENKLREIVHELTKPIYEKIGDTLVKIGKVQDK